MSSSQAQADQSEPGTGRVQSQDRPPSHKRPGPPHPNGPRKGKKRINKRERAIAEASSEEVLRADIQALIASLSLSEDQDQSHDPKPPVQDEENEDQTDGASLPELGSEIEIKIHALSSTGDGLGTPVPPPCSESSPSSPVAKHVIVVPFTLPGDTVRARVYRHNIPEQHSLADFLAVVTPSPKRDDSLVRCRYFASCAGCQLQMLDYAEQLRVKRSVVERAFANFSNLPPERIPVVGETVASPLQYGYRTKLTPHFPMPPGAPSRGRRKAKGEREGFRECPSVGYMKKGTRHVIDIEDCPIGTEAVLKGLARERARMKVEYGKYKKGATILLRESTKRFPRSEEAAPVADSEDENAVKVETDEFTDVKTCITDPKALSTEFVGSQRFVNPAGSFFQNNNSILPVITAYIRDNILPPTTTSSPSSAKPIRHLIDAYSGSGLFTITLSTLPSLLSSTGIDIDPNSIASARRNATLNSIPEDRAKFIAADAGELFKNVEYDPDETVVVLDPPRKGCDADFLGQLLKFGPRRIAYVSCNVHTQARDIGVLVRGLEGGEKATRYDIDTLRGFDFFPQTAHVEGVAFLNRVDEATTEP